MNLEPYKTRLAAAIEMLEELREDHTMTASEVFTDGVWCDECGYGNCVAHLLTTATTDIAELVAEVERLQGVVDAARRLGEEWISLGIVSVHESSLELGESVLAALEMEGEA